MTLAIISALVIAAPLLAFAYLVVSGAKVVRHGKPQYANVTWGGGVVRLPADKETTAPGVFGVWVGSRERPGHLLVGALIERTHEQAARRILAVSGAPESGQGEGRFVGHVFPGPEAVAPGRWSEVQVPGPTGPCPAWLITPPGGSSETWAIHVHGIGTTRVAVLRSVPVAEALGMTSLVPSFRGDGEGPQTHGGASTLGTHEHLDIAAAIDYATQRGAKNIVLIPWSMGASVGLLAATKARRPESIAAVVAVAPVTDWSEVIFAGARRAHLPAALARFTAWGLERRLITALLGMDSVADFTAVNRAVERVASTIPTMLVHSVEDPLVPFSGSAALAAKHPDTVVLRRYDCVGHAWEYNSDPDAFEREISEWIASAVSRRQID